MRIIHDASTGTLIRSNACAVNVSSGTVLVLCLLNYWSIARSKVVFVEMKLYVKEKSYLQY